MRQQQLIKGNLGSDSFSLEELQAMHKNLANAGCDFEAAYVMELIKDKQDPTYFFRIKTYEEALCFLENVFQTKIRRLEDWFTDEELENK